MKEIAILLVTFLGICKGFSQNGSVNNTTDSIKKPGVSLQKVSTDSLISKEKATAKLYPNPAKNKIELEVKGFEAGLVRLQIIDISGKLLRDDKRLLFSGNENIVVMFALPPGIYFIVLKQNTEVVKKKLLVQ